MESSSTENINIGNMKRGLEEILEKTNYVFNISGTVNIYGEGPICVKCSSNTASTSDPKTSCMMCSSNTSASCEMRTSAKKDTHCPTSSAKLSSNISSASALKTSGQTITKVLREISTVGVSLITIMLRLNPHLYLIRYQILLIQPLLHIPRPRPHLHLPSPFPHKSLLKI